MSLFVTLLLQGEETTARLCPPPPGPPHSERPEQGERRHLSSRAPVDACGGTQGRKERGAVPR
jgi:hypothetical protein